MKHATPFTLMIWAWSSVVHAQLRPMDTHTAPPAGAVVLAPMQPGYVQVPALQPMAAATGVVQGALVRMGDVQAATGNAPVLVPLVPRPAEVDHMLWPLARAGAPQVMKAQMVPKLVHGLPGLPPLPPPQPPAGTKPAALKLPAAPLRKVRAAENSVGTARPVDALPAGVATLTDVEDSPDPHIPLTARPEDQLLAVSVVINGTPRRGLMEIYHADDRTLWLPLTPLAEYLDMPIRVNAAAGVVRGWYQAPTNTLVLSMKKNLLQVGEKSFPVVARVEKHEGDLYVAAPSVKEWFGIEARLDYNQLRLLLTTPMPLPGDLRAKREANWEAVSDTLRVPELPADTIHPGTAAFSVPLVRLGAHTNLSRPEGGSMGADGGLTVQTENDLFGATATMSLAFLRQRNGETGLNGGNVLLEKKSVRGDLMGPLGATYAGLGDIHTTGLPLSGLSTRGRGVRLNNLPEGAAPNPDQFIISGPAPINWDVEVYQNQSLVAYARVDNTGTYRFTALPLRTGRNVFRIVLFGPNGEREERNETTYLGANMPLPGAVQYDAAAYQPGRNMVPGLPNANSATATVMQAQLTTGIARNWAATLGGFDSLGAYSPMAGARQPRQGASGGIRGAFGATYLTGDLTTTDLGQANQTSVRLPLTALADLRLVRTQNMGYKAADRDEVLVHEAELAVPLQVGRMAFDNTFGYTRSSYQTQQLQQAYSHRLSFATGRLHATNGLEYVTQGNTTNINGTLEAASHVLATSVRAGVTYQPQSPDLLRQFYVNTQLPVGGGRTANMTYTQQLTAPNTSSLAGGVFWNIGAFALGLQGQASSQGSMQLGLNMTTALVPTGYKRAAWELASPNAAMGLGQTAIRVFADTNGNFRHDAGEPVYPGVTVHNRQKGTSRQTDVNGQAVFANLAPDMLNRMEIDQTTLPDIYLKPVSDTLNVFAHRGDNGVLDYALQVYGEVAGRVETPDGRPVQNMALRLIDAVGKVRDRTQSEADGTFVFGALPMGGYTVVPQDGAGQPVMLSPAERFPSVKVLFAASRL